MTKNYRYGKVEWGGSRQFDHIVPIISSSRGGTVVGFPLEPEVDAFLNSNSLILRSTRPSIAGEIAAVVSPPELIGDQLSLLRVMARVR